MSCYRLVFVNNEVVSCTETDQHPDLKSSYYAQRDGNMIFAIVQAEDNAQALELAAGLVKEIQPEKVANKSTQDTLLVPLLFLAKSLKL